MKPTNSRSTSPASPARANSRALLLAAALALAGCAGIDGRDLVPGQSTQQDVEAVMGRPADKRIGPQGEIVYWYPQHPHGRASYAARIAADGKLIAVEQRLTEANTAKVVKGMPREQVYELLGPAWEPIVYMPLGREVWTYPMRVRGYTYPRWFVVYLTLDERVVSETYLMDDLNAYPPQGFRRH